MGEKRNISHIKKEEKNGIIKCSTETTKCTKKVEDKQNKTLNRGNKNKLVTTMVAI